MERRTLWIASGIALALILGAVIAAPYLLPKQTTTLNQEAPGAMDGMEPAVTVHREGAWRDGDAAHRASGNIAIVTIEGDNYLRFTDFQMTAGPDVYLYLTPSANPQSKADVEGDGRRILVSTDEDTDDRLNERGTFFVPLQMSLAQLGAYQGVAAWCDDFNVLFGSASLGSP